MPIIAYEHNPRLDIAHNRSAERFRPHNSLGPSSDVSHSPSTRVARTATRTASRDTRLALGNHRTAPTDSPLLRIASPCPVPRRCPHGPAIQRPSGGDAHLTAPEPSKVPGCTSVESLDLRLARRHLDRDLREFADQLRDRKAAVRPCRASDRDERQTGARPHRIRLRRNRPPDVSGADERPSASRPVSIAQRSPNIREPAG